MSGDGWNDRERSRDEKDTIASVVGRAYKEPTIDETATHFLIALRQRLSERTKRDGRPSASGSYRIGTRSIYILRDPTADSGGVQ